MSRPAALHLQFSVHAALQRGHVEIDLVDLVRCLRTVSDKNSITAAADALDVTYRTLWGKLQALDDALGCKLVGKARGRGTQLTSKGRAVLAALERHGALFLPPPAEPVAALLGDLGRALRDQAHLRLMASHDFALAKALSTRRAPVFGEADPAACTTAVDLAESIQLTLAGSSSCVRALLRGEADLAGYHHVSRPLTTAPKAPWDALETNDDYWNLPILEREQGLIVAPRVRRNVKALADLTRPGVRFVNRQRGSGTRILLDALLMEAGVAASGIDGYEHEEFTHQAVAATVAAGGADAGPGLRAAAAQFNLGFIPLATETYRLAGRAETRTHDAVNALIVATQALAALLPGYRVLRTPK